MEQISTAEDFRKAAQERLVKEGEVVKLPSGLTVVARQLGPDWWLRRLGQLPTTIADRLIGAHDVDFKPTIQDLLTYSKWTVTIIQDMVISPTIKLNPGLNEVDPGWLSDDDVKFLIRYAGGEVSATGASLADFPRQP